VDLQARMKCAARTSRQRGAITVLTGALAWSIAGVCCAKAQSLAGFRIGEAAAKLKPLGDPAATAPDGDYRNQKWTLPTGNDLAVTTSPDGLIVFLESDSGGKDADPGCDLPGLKFGSTTLTDLRKRFGSGGFGFQNRSTAIEGDDGGTVMMNSYEVGTNVVTFITRVSKDDYARSKDPSAKVDLAGHARLDAIMISDSQYAIREWGPRIYGADYKKIEWK